MNDKLIPKKVFVVEHTESFGENHRVEAIFHTEKGAVEYANHCNEHEEYCDSRYYVVEYNMED